MQVNFYLSAEFGYENDVQADAIARTSNGHYVLVKLPEGYQPNEHVHNGVIACDTSFLGIAEEQRASLPMWTADQEVRFADSI